MGSTRAFIFALLGFMVLHGCSFYSAEAAVHHYTFIVSVYTYRDTTSLCIPRTSSSPFNFGIMSWSTVFEVHVLDLGPGSVSSSIGMLKQGQYGYEAGRAESCSLRSFMPRTQFAWRRFVLIRGSSFRPIRLECEVEGEKHVAVSHFSPCLAKE